MNSSSLRNTFRNRIHFACKWSAMAAISAVLVACGRTDTKANDTPPTADAAAIAAPAPAVQSAQTEAIQAPAKASTPEVKQSPEEAHKFATEYYQKVLEQEAFLKDAVRLKEVATVNKISIDAITSKPKWPQDGSADPYTECDTAWIDLGLLASVQHKLLREESAELKRIERQEAADYAKSKAACAKRVKMTPAQAIAAEAAQ